MRGACAHESSVIMNDNVKPAHEYVAFCRWAECRRRLWFILRHDSVPVSCGSGHAGGGTLTVRERWQVRGTWRRVRTVLRPWFRVHKSWFQAIRDQHAVITWNEEVKVKWKVKAGIEVTGWLISHILAVPLQPTKHPSPHPPNGH